MPIYQWLIYRRETGHRANYTSKDHLLAREMTELFEARRA